MVFGDGYGWPMAGKTKMMLNAGALIRGFFSPGYVYNQYHVSIGGLF